MDESIKKIIIWSAAGLLIVEIIGVILKLEEIYIGFLLGGAIAILNFYMIAGDMNVVVRTGERAKRVAYARFIRRYLIVFLIISIAFFVFNFKNFIGLICGLFIVRFMIILQKNILRK